MAGDVEEGQSSGLSRRQVIKASAVAGAAAWTAPMIIDSLSSPAAAGSGATVQNCISYIAFTMTCSGVQQNVKFEGDAPPSGNGYPELPPECGVFAAPDCSVLGTCSGGSSPSYPTNIGSSTCPAGLGSSVTTGTPGVVTVALPAGCTVDDNRVWRHKGNITCKCDTWVGSQSGTTFSVTLTGVNC